jgi:aspartyl-tRNA(Asn)/glutamyl-tRNA(Gln) amidotransferase subunit C
MSVTPEEVRHVARLARLALDDTQLPSLATELNGILAHMDVLQQVHLPDTPAEAERGMPLRPDDGTPEPLQNSRESFAPSMRDGFFLVPRLGTHGEAGATSAEP